MFKRLPIVQLIIVAMLFDTGYLALKEARTSALAAKDTRQIARATKALTANEQQLCGNVVVLAMAVQRMSKSSHIIEQKTKFSGLQTYKGAIEQHRSSTLRGITDALLAKRITQIQFANCHALIISPEIEK